jgi:O-antigen ligase
MKPTDRRPAREILASRGSLVVMAAMMITVPLVGIQGPAHTTVMDAVNVVFAVVFWLYLLSRHEPPDLPLLFPLWLILVGSCGSLFVAREAERALLVIGQDLYLYLWFVAAAAFLARRCRLRAVTGIWIAVATAVAVLAFVDLHTRAFGGEFAAGETRASGTFENPNMFGSYLVVAFFLTWALAARGRPLLSLVMPALAMGVLSTASNGALMSLLIGSTVALLARPTRRQALRLGMLLAAAGLTLGLLGVFREEAGEALETLLNRERGELGGAAYKGWEARLPVWLDVAEMMQEKPVGVGPGNLGRERGRLSGTYHGAHNEYLAMLGERGPLGLLGWCALLVGVGGFLRRLRWAAAAGVQPLAVEPLYGLLAALAAHAFVIELSHFRHLWLAFALLWAAAEQATQAVTTQTAAAVPPRPIMREAA